MNNIIVTGGAGYIGAHCCKYLKSIGFNPITYDNLSRGNRDFVKWGDLIIGDIGDKFFLRKVLNHYKPQAVIHFAAFAYVSESVEFPNLYYKNNVLNSITLIDECRLAGIKNFIFSSSCAVYGSTNCMKIKETDLLNPINPYGRSKLMVEEILEDYAKIFNFNSISLRYFNASGASKDLDIGENHNPETHLIPNVILTALKLKETLKIYGYKFKTIDGTAVRDYVHVDDLAIAHAKALLYLLSINEYGKSFKFNLGTGLGTSVLEIINLTQELLNTKINVEYCDPRNGDPEILIADPSSAKHALDLNFASSSIENILLSSIKWLKFLHDK
jgi:UDP-glucose-4-epimerase GalE